MLKYIASTEKDKLLAAASLTEYITCPLICSKLCKAILIYMISIRLKATILEVELLISLVSKNEAFKSRMFHKPRITNTTRNHITRL